MKKISILLIIVIFLNEHDCFSQKTFSRFYNVKNNSIEEFESLDVLKDGYFISGHVNDNIFTAVLDTSFKVVSAKEYKTDSNIIRVFSSKTLITSSHEVVIVANCYYNSEKYNTAEIIFKCDAFGKVLWAKQIKSKLYKDLYPEVIAEGENESILLQQKVADQVIEIIRIGKNGSLIWNTTLDLKLSPYDIYFGKSIVEKGDKIYIGGNEDCEECEGVFSPYIIKLTQKGDPVTFQNIYYSPYRYTRSVSLNEIFLKNNKLYVFVRSSFEGFSLLPLMDTTTQGSAMGYGRRDQAPLEEQYSIQRLLLERKNLLPLRLTNSFSTNYYFKNGNRLSSSIGYYYNNKTYYGIFLNQYDSMGRTCLDYEGYENDTTKTNISYELSEDKTHQVIKDSMFFNDIKIYDSSISMNSKILCESYADAVASKESTNAALNKVDQGAIYPNPAHNQITLNYNSLQSQATTILIQSLTGKNLISKKMTLNKGANNLVVNIQSLSQGFYYLKIIGSNKISSFKFLKQ